MEKVYNYSPLKYPTALIKQSWDKGILPIVSVSCVTYNHVHFIRNTIEGFLMQKTTFPVRICIFDDCSTDGNQEILKKYEAKYPYLFFITYAKENTWKKPTRKEARKPFREARNVAKYIAVCEGDDYWTDPLKLQKQVSFLEQHEDYALCVGGFREVNYYSKKTTDVIRIPPRVKRNEFGYTFGLNDTQINWITKTLTLVYRYSPECMSLLRQYNHTRDTHLIYHLLKTGKGFYFADILGVYNQHLGGVFSMQSNKDKATVLYSIYKELFEVNNDKWTKKKYFNSIMGLFNFYLFSKQDKQSFRYYLHLYFLGLKNMTRLSDIKVLLYAFLAPTFKARLKNLKED